MLLAFFLNASGSAIAFDLFPFRPTDQNMRARRDPRWAGLWQALKTAYDLFETRRLPPRVTVRDGNYVVSAPQ